MINIAFSLAKASFIPYSHQLTVFTQGLRHLPEKNEKFNRGILFL